MTGRASIEGMDQSDQEPQVIYVVDRDRDKMPAWVKGLIAVILAGGLLWWVNHEMEASERYAHEKVCREFGTPGIGDCRDVAP